MSDSEHDDEFEAYLKRRVPIHKGMTTPERLEPPPELDRLVIGKARKAIQDAAPVHLYRAPKWALPVGLAATIVISFAVILELGVQERHRQTAPAKGTDTTLSSGTSPALDGATAMSSEVPKVPPIPTNPWAPSSQGPSSRAATPDIASSSAPAAKQVEEKARTRMARTEAATTRSRPGGALTAAAQPAVTSTSTTTLEEAADTRRAAAAPETSLPTPAIDTAQAGHPDPAVWFTQIEKLRAAGQIARAEQELKRFRESYPEYRLEPQPPPDGRAQ